VGPSPRAGRKRAAKLRVGRELQFIDWDDTIEPESPTLKWRREGSLAMKLVNPAIIEDHLLQNYSNGLGC
jgi:hypothetical protein